MNDAISVVIPTVGEILENEDAYFNMVLSITAMPIDMMVQLDEIGVDFTAINEYELFLLMFSGLQSQDTSLIFGELDLSKFKPCVNTQNGMIVLRDAESGVVIDRAIHEQIADLLRRIHRLDKNIKKPANGAAKAFMLRRAKDKLRRQRGRKKESQIEQFIVSLVNTEQYKYDFEGTLRLSIFQFNECVRQVIKKIDYDNRMIGVYAGTISAKELSQEDLSWLSQK